MQYVHIELFFITLTWIQPRINGTLPKNGPDFCQRVLKEFANRFYCKTCIV